MGGYMSYQRMRFRNNIMARKPEGDTDPYWRDGNPPSRHQPNLYCLVGDLNRMEQDYIGHSTVSEHEGYRYTGPRGLVREVADMTGVDEGSVERVLRFVLLGEVLDVE